MVNTIHFSTDAKGIPQTKCLRWSKEKGKVKEVKISLLQDMEAHRVARG
jgi:hypothetical protein